MARPYVGVGVNFTKVWGVSITVPGAATTSGTALPLDISRESVGLAAQIGVDVPLGGGWLLNLDVKKLQLGVDVKAGGAKVGEFSIDPLLFGIGVGKRF